ncbi:ferredoxin--NADP+ reductase, partial [Haematococcus lacustris]
NVALDCARILLQPPARLQPTDIADHALAPGVGPGGGLSCVQHVHLVARRGPVQAACTPKELKELVAELGFIVHASAQQLTVSEADCAVLKASRSKRRVVDIIKQVLLDDAGSVRGLRVEVTHLITPPGASAPVAVGTGVYEDIDAQLVLVSIGYKSLPVAGAPFDAKSGTIPHRGGRVLQAVGGPLKAAAAGEEQGPQNGISRGGAADAGKSEGVTL